MSKYNPRRISMPNEIFRDLKGEVRTSKHMAFAYTYYYYITYMYRYCEHTVGTELVTQSAIKETLGFSPIQKSVDYIIKKAGVLDNIGYTSTTGDYPVSFELDEDMFVMFRTISEFKDGINEKLNLRHKIKYPIKAFHRTSESVVTRELDGTFYDLRSTHSIDYSVFTSMMQDSKQLGVMAFYIYGYLKYKNGLHSNQFESSCRSLSSQLGIKDKDTVLKYLHNMDGRYISIVGSQPHESERKASKYQILC